MNCPFCDTQILEKQKIYETEREIVLYNLAPRTVGQCLVIPKRHLADVREFKAEELLSLMQTVKFVSEKLKKHLNPIGFNYGFNEGEHAGQTVFHFHFHIMPRFADDGIKQVHLFRQDSTERKFLSSEELAPLIDEFRKTLK